MILVIKFTDNSVFRKEFRSLFIDTGEIASKLVLNNFTYWILTGNIVEMKVE